MPNFAHPSHYMQQSYPHCLVIPVPIHENTILYTRAIKREPHNWEGVLYGNTRDTS